MFLAYFVYLNIQNGADFASTHMGVKYSGLIAAAFLFFGTVLVTFNNFIVIVQLLTRTPQQNMTTTHTSTNRSSKIAATKSRHVERNLTINSIFLALNMFTYLIVSLLVILGIIENLAVWVVISDVFTLSNPIVLLTISKTTRKELFGNGVSTARVTQFGK